MTDTIQPSKEVIDFAQKAGYKWGVEFVREWNNFQVFFPNLEPNIGFIDSGLPQYILVKENKIRWADTKEQSELMYLDNQEA